MIHDCKVKMKITLSRIVVTFITVICLLFAINSLMGLKINLLWMYYPELDVENIWRNEVVNNTDLKTDALGPVLHNDHTSNNINTSDGFSVISESQSANSQNNNFTEVKGINIYTDAEKQCDIRNPSRKFDCFPENNVSEEGCVNRGCCWHKDEARRKPLYSKKESETQAPVDVPYCFYPQNFPSYSVIERKDTSFGFKMNLTGQPPIFYPNGVKELAIDVYFETDQRLHIKIYDAVNKRYEVPLNVPRPNRKAANPVYTVTASDLGSPFWLSVSRTSDQTNVFSTKGAAPLIFTDQFLQLSSLLPSPYIYGIGEHRDNLMLNVNWTRKTLWNLDHIPEEDLNLYGSHPFYLLMEENGRSSGFFLLNSNAMDVVLQPYPAVTWRTIGGILDFYIFIGQNPADVMREYTNVIGRTFMPPYWSLGLHICRFGYKSVNDTMNVVNRIKKAGIPQDVQWNDIDYAVKKRDFTTDTLRFGNQAAMVDEIHKRGMKYMIIVDPGISNTQPSGTYRPYDLGVEMDIFIKNESGQLLVGQVWPGPTVFPDFSNEKAYLYWATLIKEYTSKISVDGLWIDMNEIATFVDGSLDGCPSSKYDSPPYVPAVVNGKLCWRTICASARQKLSVHYDLHNLYGLMETMATYEALKALPSGKRPFIISRATSPGQGHYGGHWTGDNVATFHDLYRSISAILTMNLAGIPMVGADICGFNGNTTYELCLRWYQLGAFYPFSRSHNSDLVRKEQDPGAFDAFFAASVREVYWTRYSLLPYLYTLFFESYKNGTPVARAMFYEFPKHKDTYQIDSQFMWGSALLIVPVLTENARKVEVYLPAGSLWYCFYSGYRFDGKGENFTLSAPLNTINLLVQGGTIIPMQEPALTTSESIKNDLSLLVSLGLNGTASGALYRDDGESQNSLESETYTFLTFSLKNQQLQSTIVKASYLFNTLLKNITIYGVERSPERVSMNGATQMFKYKSDLKVLEIPSLVPKVYLMKPFLLDWT